MAMNANIGQNLQHFTGKDYLSILVKNLEWGDNLTQTNTLAHLFYHKLIIWNEL